LSSQLKLRGGREERDMGAGRLGGYPLCGPHSGTCGGAKAACICVFVRENEREGARERERERERERGRER